MLNFEPPWGPEPGGARPNKPANSLPDSGPLLTHCLMQLLDHVGRGMLLVGPGGRLLHANRLAQTALAAQGHALRAEHGRITARSLRDQQLLAAAIEAALHKGVRRLLTLGRDAEEAQPPTGDAPGSDTGTGALTLAVLPIESPFDHRFDSPINTPHGAPQPPDGKAGPPWRAQAVLISLPQCSHSKNLAVPIFAREHGCTDAEVEVLEALLAGHTPDAIALQRDVHLCTVRTQIGQLRQKTGARTIRALLERVAALPPMMVVLQ